MNKLLVDFILCIILFVSPPIFLFGQTKSVISDSTSYFSPYEYHQYLLKQIKPSLAYSDQQNIEEWQLKLRKKLVEILAVPMTWDHNITYKITPESETEEYTVDKIEFRSEPFADVPGYLMKPKNLAPPYPVMICLQGHAPGMHISMGHAKSEKEVKLIEGGRDIALQALQNGWAALVIEQRGFGLREGRNKNRDVDATLQALMLGKTITGERVFDVMRVIDFIYQQDDLDVDKIGCLGNSTGGTISFYAACVDPRIRMAVVSCSFCTYAGSWME